MRSKVFLFVLILFCATFAFSYETTKTLDLSAAGIDKLDIKCGAGFLKVYGDKSLDAIKVEAEIVIKRKTDKKAKEIVEKYMNLSLKKSGSRAVLTSSFKTRATIFSSLNAVINLTVKIPQNMDLFVDDGSGFIKIGDIAGRLDIEDGSGEIQVTNIDGDVDIDDGSGAITAEKITGNVIIDDGSGEITVKSVKGNVRIDDGSGSINVSDVEKDVILKATGSGGVNINNVKGKIIK